MKKIDIHVSYHAAIPPQQGEEERPLVATSTWNEAILLIEVVSGACDKELI